MPGADPQNLRVPCLAISMGDPLGIGPEVLVKALADPSLRGRGAFVVFGMEAPLIAAARGSGLEPFWRSLPRGAALTCPPRRGDVLLLEDAAVTATIDLSRDQRTDLAASGAASFRWVEDAISAVRPSPGGPPVCDAIVTGPISKRAWALAGHGAFPGHTELLAARFEASRSRMMFWSSRIRTMLVTTHIPLALVPGALSVERVLDTIVAGHEAVERFGLRSPRIAVCGLNPHAGEAGLLGSEDERLIAPAVRAARGRSIDASGPWPGDTIFHAAIEGRHDLVVAMYHDQGLIPIKLVAFHEAVNVTVGLPVIRTSPDHGTAFDIAGRGLADPGSMRAAIDLALRGLSPGSG